VSVQTLLVWGGFVLFILAMLAIDLGIFHRKSHTVSMREAGIWTAVWISLATLFGLGLWLFSGSERALAFAAGYVIEYSLSMDNIFVFVLIFTYFAVPAAYQHRVLFWGIVGALIMRGVMIAAGTALIKQFHWIIYIFGAFLVFTGIRMAFHNNEEIHPEQNPLIHIFRRFMRVTRDYQGEHFFVRQAGVLMATPLFLVLLMVESTDLIFAVDSIPAIFAVTTDPFIVFTSNVFATLGLRSLYFILAGAVDKFHYLKLGLSAVLTFVGVKMLVSEWYKLPTAISLLIIVLLLGTAILASIIRVRRLEAAGLPVPSELEPTDVRRPGALSPSGTERAPRQVRAPLHLEVSGEDRG
jgi:tellurite resistance protein TerC